MSPADACSELDGIVARRLRDDSNIGRLALAAHVAVDAGLARHPLRATAVAVEEAARRIVGLRQPGRLVLCEEAPRRVAPMALPDVDDVAVRLRRYLCTNRPVSRVDASMA